jgi:flagellar basal-body rod protein FlgG
MDMSFYTGAVGAAQAQKKLNVVSNNLANVETTGYKPKNATFSELIQYNLHAPEDEITAIQTGAGGIVSAAPASFRTSSFSETGRKLDFAIGSDNTFFMLQDPETGVVTYTRDGSFHAGTEADGTVALLSSSGKYVLDANGQKITGDDAAALEEDADQIGLYSVRYPSRLLSTGNNEYTVRTRDTNNTATAVTERSLTQGYLESSGTDVAKEMVDTIEAQRAFSYALRMVQTSNEVASTINSLRG